MVGMVIGMLGIIVMMQVFALAEGQKRATTGGGDAQSNGAIALYGLQRDLRQAGYGISDVNVIGCGVQLRAGVILPAMAPVTINPKKSDGITNLLPLGDANTDTLLVAYGNANSAPQGDGITAQPPLAVTTYTVMASSSFAADDQVVAVPQTRPSPCSLVMDKVSGNPLALNVPVTTGDPGHPSMSNGRLYNLGPKPKVWAYAIRNGNLTFCDYVANDCGAAGNKDDAAIWVPIANNVVSIRALYGKDTTDLITPRMDGIVDAYDQTTPTTACGWVRTSAVRIALVARNGNLDKDLVTTTAPTWAGTASAPIDLSADSKWQNYRYKTFETVIALRNIAWMGVQTGC